MSHPLGLTLLVVGFVAGAWAVLMWIKKRGHAQNWVILLMVVAGIGIGTGLGSLVSVNIVNARVGYVPVWLIVVAIVGFGFFLEVKGWRKHHTRTPLLGAAVALVLCLAIGQATAAGLTHGIRNVQVTSNITGTKG